MDEHLAHTPWRAIYTDCFTADAFLARRALDDGRPVTIQMALLGDLTERDATIDLRPVTAEADCDQLLQLVLADHAGGRRTQGLRRSAEFSAVKIANYGAKSRATIRIGDACGTSLAYGVYTATRRMGRHDRGSLHPADGAATGNATAIITLLPTARAALAATPFSSVRWPTRISGVEFERERCRTSAPELAISQRINYGGGPCLMRTRAHARSAHRARLSRQATAADNK